MGHYIDFLCPQMDNRRFQNAVCQLSRSVSTSLVPFLREHRSYPFCARRCCEPTRPRPACKLKTEVDFNGGFTRTRGVAHLCRFENWAGEMQALVFPWAWDDPTDAGRDFGPEHPMGNAMSGQSGRSIAVAPITHYLVGRSIHKTPSRRSALRHTVSVSSSIACVIPTEDALDSPDSDDPDWAVAEPRQAFLPLIRPR